MVSSCWRRCREPLETGAEPRLREVFLTLTSGTKMKLWHWGLALLGGGGAFVLSCSNSNERTPASHPRFVGTAPSSDRDFETALPHFSQITPENASKWGSVEAERDVMRWSGVDRAYDFARERGLEFKFHALVWGQQEPPWISELPQEEQLEELEEWISLVAERYPDLELIDVVNEPLHAPPSYRNALGGEGATGWDWVIRSFELSREYLPNAELILNDYDILKHHTFTADYLAVIELLQERDLVDAIGLQAHNLERSEKSVIDENLATLSAAGLPLYISEFDIDIKDDALHARVFRDLFTTFWDAPKVAGITLWGHLQGDTWRPNTYLIRRDDSVRPTMKWLQCFRQSRSDCKIPDYHPEPRRGSINGITLEAETFDETGGAIVLGSQIGYVDEGDWINFLAVRFLPEWDQLTLIYANGLDQTGTASFHLQTLDAEPAVTVSLPPTGGWGNQRAVTVEFPPTEGDQDLFVRFNEVDGVGNFDKFRFGLPAPELDESNLISTGDFEFDTTGWLGWGATVLIELDNVYRGAQSLRLSDRSQYGAAVYDLRSSVVPGQTYDFSFFADSAGEDSAAVSVSITQTCSSEAAVVEPVVESFSLSPGEWTEVSGSFSVLDCSLSQVRFLISGPPAGTDLFIDDVRVE